MSNELPPVAGPADAPPLEGHAYDCALNDPTPIIAGESPKMAALNRAMNKCTCRPADAVRPLTREELDFDVRRIREYFEMLRVEIAGDSRIASDGEGPWLSAVTSSFNRIESAARASVEAQEDRERIEWLERERPEIDYAHDIALWRHTERDVLPLSNQHTTLRAAIDDAREYDGFRAFRRAATAGAKGLRTTRSGLRANDSGAEHDRA